MKKEVRAEVLKLIYEYCSGIDENALVCVLEMARAFWKEAKRKKATAEAAAAISEARCKIFYLFGSDHEQE